MLGTGEWNAYLTERGGGTRILDLKFSGLQASFQTDGSTQATVTLADESWSEARRIARSWEHEVLVLRDNDEAFVGPVITASKNTLQCQDLFYWTEVRTFDRDYVNKADLSHIFRDIFDNAMDKDRSPNVDLFIHDCGILSTRRYQKEDARSAADLLRELGRTGLDFITVGRTVYVGGPEIVAPNDSPLDPLVLHDEAVVPRAEVTRDGGRVASDVRVFAGRQKPDGTSRAKPLIGRSIGGIRRLGLVQRTYTELLLQDLDAANENARSRRLASGDFKVVADVTAKADWSFRDMRCGRRVDCRLTEDAADEEVMETMRLVAYTINVNVGAGNAGQTETINVTLNPLEEFDENA